MSINPALLSSNMEHWLSPPAIIVPVVRVHEVIDMDPGTNRASIVPATSHCYVGEQDGLTTPWIGNVYVNPKYGAEIKLWTARMRQCGGELRSCSIIALLPARVDTVWCQKDVLSSADAWCFWAGRLTFWKAWDRGALAKKLRQPVARLRLPEPFRVLDSGIIVGPDLDKGGKPMPAPFPSLAPYWGDDPVTFAREFVGHGVVTIRKGEHRGTYPHKPRRTA